MTDLIRVFVNGKGVSVAPGSTVLQAVAGADPAAAAELSAGTRAVADSRGIVIPADTIVSGGHVLRLVSSRAG